MKRRQRSFREHDDPGKRRRASASVSVLLRDAGNGSRSSRASSELRNLRSNSALWITRRESPIKSSSGSAICAKTPAHRELFPVQAVNGYGLGRNIPFRLDESVKEFARRKSAVQLYATDLDQPMTFFNFQSCGFRIENNLTHRPAVFAPAASNSAATRRTSWKACANPLSGLNHKIGFCTLFRVRQLACLQKREFFACHSRARQVHAAPVPSRVLTQQSIASTASSEPVSKRSGISRRPRFSHVRRE